MLSRRFLLYLVIGGVNTLVGYCLYSCLIFVGLHYAAATVLATIFSVLFNFKSTGRVVFGSDNSRLLLRFVAVYTIVCLFNVFALRLYGFFDDNMYLAGVLVLFPSALFSFLLLKNFVFNPKKPDGIRG
jgi:putative flippase GtrA